MLLQHWNPFYESIWIGPFILIPLDLILILRYLYNPSFLISLIPFLLGFKEGDALIFEKYWNHWMDDTEPLVWIDTVVR